jgi:hypothetical protein
MKEKKIKKAWAISYTGDDISFGSPVGTILLYLTKKEAEKRKPSENWLVRRVEIKLV